MLDGAPDIFHVYKDPFPDWCEAQMEARRLHFHDSQVHFRFHVRSRYLYRYYLQLLDLDLGMECLD